MGDDHIYIGQALFAAHINQESTSVPDVLLLRADGISEPDFYATRMVSRFPE